MLMKRFFGFTITLFILLSLLPMNTVAAAATKTPTLESEMHKYTDEPIVASTKGDLAIPVYNYMTVNTRMNGTLSNSLPFYSSPSASECNKLGDIPHLTTVYVYGVTAEKFGYRHWAIIDYNGTFGFVSANYIEDTAATIPPPTSTPTPTPAPIIVSQNETVSMEEYASEVLRLVNVERKKAGLSSLTEVSALSTAAMQRANEIIQVFSHTRPDGRASNTVTEDFGLDCSYQGENIASGYRTPAEVVNGWMNSSGHKANILNSNYKYLGVGVAADSNGKLYWVQCFVKTYKSTSKTTTANGTVYIKYNANGGSNAPISHNVYKDNSGAAKYTLSLTKPTRNGYNFLGWRLDNDADYGIDAPGQSIAIDIGNAKSNSTITYYAQWEPTANAPTTVSKVSYPAAPYFIYGGGEWEDIQYNANGEITKVTYYLADGSLRGWSEFKRAIDRYEFIRTDYWHENGKLAYYVVNELDTNGDVKVAYFYNANGKLFDTVRN